MTTEAFASGTPCEDEGPVLGSGWWHALSFLLLISGAFFGWRLFAEASSASNSEQRRQIAMAIAILGPLPMTITIIQFIRLRRKLGTAQLFVPHRFFAMGFSGTATYLRPLRGGAAVREIEARLQCEEELEKGSGKNKKTYTKIVYDEQITPVSTPMMEQMRVQIPFRIPQAGPPSLLESRATIRWMLRLRLKMEGCPNTRSSFEIQVFPAVVKR